MKYSERKISHYILLLTALINYSMPSNSNSTFLTNNVREIQSSKKRIRLIDYFKSQPNHNGVLLYNKYILVLKTKVHGLMILTVRYFFLTVHLTHAVF